MTERHRIEYPELFIDCLAAVMTNPEILVEFHRLTGFDISRNKPAIVQAIDDASGYFEAGVKAFYEFVYECVYSRVVGDLGGDTRYPRVGKVSGELEKF